MTEQKSTANAMVLATNGLRYTMPKPLSTSLVRTFKKQYSQRQTYNDGDTIVFDLNVNGMVDPEISYLVFSLSSDEEFKFGQNGACSIIRDIRISSKNGVELDRIQSFNAWSHHYLSHMVDKSKLEKDQRIAGVNTLVNEVGEHFVIPLTWLSGLFRPHVKGQKMPSHLLSGARIELQLESVARALQAGETGANSTKFTVEKPTIVLMEHTLNDNTLKVLTEESANNGLEYVYDRVFTSIETSGNAIVNSQIKKAVSQATCIVTTVHDPAAQNNPDSNSFESIQAVSGKFAKFQYRLGSNYFPHQVCDTTEEAYRITESAYDCSRDKSCVSSNDWISYLTKFFAVGVPLKSEHSISSSGLAVNNSATIALEYEGDASNKIYYTFLTYTALARVFLQQTSVKI